MHWDLLIRGATVFDGSGGPGERLDIAVKDGRIAAQGAGLPETAAAEVHDGAGAWLIPGLLDIHTHEDLEVELEPGLPEVVRHGTTSVITGNCSIGLAFGNQRRDGQDPIVDCFARVENIPKTVLAKAADKATWRTTAEYLAHLDELPLGANLAPLVPHSMLRIEVMGLEDSIRRDPPRRSSGAWRRCSTAPWARATSASPPTGCPALSRQPAPRRQAHSHAIRVVCRVPAPDRRVRRHGRVWQMTPATDDGALTLKLFLLTSGRLYRRPLKITALAAIDSVNNRSNRSRAKAFARLLNSRLVNGRFRMQSLAAPFKIWSEGAVSPLAEGNPLMRRLIETELEDREARRRILEGPGVRRGVSGDVEPRQVGLQPGPPAPRAAPRERVPHPGSQRHGDLPGAGAGWAGLSMAEIFDRYRAWRASGGGQDNAEEALAFNAIGAAIRDDGEFFLALLRHFDRDLYWHYVAANRDPKVIRELLLHPQMLPGFNDSGAHVTNMAYYDGNLRALSIGAVESEALFSRMVQRLTREPAEFFGLDVGRMAIGSQADLVMIDPERLKAYDGDAAIRLIHREAFGGEQLVNRSDGVVRATYVAGRRLWHGSGFDNVFGRERAGRALTAA
jgi:N-acyl-D-aspartate/D-glutamate deacylase